MKENKMCCFIFKGESPSFLRIAETTQLYDNQCKGEFWFWIHNSTAKYQPELPLKYRRLTPEWVDHKGHWRVKPTAREMAELAPRKAELSINDIEIVLPVIVLQTTGFVRPQDVEKVDHWLRQKGKTRKRALKALSNRRLGITDELVEFSDMPDESMNESEQSLHCCIRLKNQAKYQEIDETATTEIVETMFGQPSCNWTAKEKKQGKVDESLTVEQRKSALFKEGKMYHELAHSYPEGVRSAAVTPESNKTVPPSEQSTISAFKLETPHLMFHLTKQMFYV